MSNLSIAGYFPFPRLVLNRQSLSQAGAGEVPIAWLEAEPSAKYKPKCSHCGTISTRVHSTQVRVVRDLALGQHQVFIQYHYRKLFCAQCGGVRSEDLEFVEPYQRLTKRLMHYVQMLCREALTVRQVAHLLNLDWKLVKRIEQQELEATYGVTDYSGLRLLAIDEIAVRKGHRYMTVILDYETGRVVWGEKVALYSLEFRSGAAVFRGHEPSATGWRGSGGHGYVAGVYLCGAGILAPSQDCLRLLPCRSSLL